MQSSISKKSPQLSPDWELLSSSLSSSLSAFSLVTSSSSLDSSHTNSLRQTRRRLSSGNVCGHLADEEVDKFVRLHDEVEIKDRAGSGTFGDVYKGTLNNTEVAIKVLKKLNKEDEFINELTHTKLEHPCIAGLIAVVAEPAHDGQPPYYYIITKYANGGTLAAYLKANSDPKSLSWQWHLLIAYDISQGLYFLHRNNIIHRDLKSENILLHQNNEHAMLCDLGAALTKTSDAAIVKAEFHGTSRYLAPELLQIIIDDAKHANDDSDEDEETKYPYSFASDVYALGILLNELIMHQKPFHDNKILTLDMYQQIISKNIRPQTDNKNASVEFVNLIKRCFDGKIQNRPSAQEIENQLEKLTKSFSS